MKAALVATLVVMAVLSAVAVILIGMWLGPGGGGK